MLTLAHGFTSECQFAYHENEINNHDLLIAKRNRNVKVIEKTDTIGKGRGTVSVGSQGGRGCWGHGQSVLV